MALQAPRGTNDILPDQAQAFHLMESAARQVFSLAGYRQIATPAFELTEVFVRGIGEATDVVGKEMFHVFSQAAAQKLAAGEALKSDERLTLRPEGTAGVARAAVQHNLVPPGAVPAKLWYAGPMFRHERPQKGRLRQFHQIGLELLGASEPAADAEVILMLMRFFVACGIPQGSMRLLLNSMGDMSCRPAYREQIRSYILAHEHELCPECVRRAQTNPLRAFDCKNPACAETMAEAPFITDALCDDCAGHYEQVKELLGDAGIAFTEAPRLVRGLDYYTRTVFEVQVDAGLGSQNAIGGGGRYDKLLEEFGGKPTCGLGFAVGLERIALVLDELGAGGAGEAAPKVFVAAAGDAPEVRRAAFSAAQALWAEGVCAETDLQARSLKSQLKLADKLGAAYCVVIGPDELASGRVALRNMATHSEQDVALSGLVAALGDELAKAGL
jgi:histidyl-tRNA synthetase